jgi:hypothetical protein
MPNCPKCAKPVYFGEFLFYYIEYLALSIVFIKILFICIKYQAEKKTSMGKDWHAACLKCERCSKTLTPGGHAVHEEKAYCHKPCYAALFGPKGD